jgi:hypothetical protein
MDRSLEFVAVKIRYSSMIILYRTVVLLEGIEKPLD